VPTIFALGRNYAAHAREMGADPAAKGDPVVFLKPWQALVAPPGPIRLPAGVGEVHHEVELVVRVGAGAVAEAIAVGLDLTDRTRQAAAKKEGLPWALAKGFRGSAPVGPFVPVAALPPLDRLRFSLKVNGEVRQSGDSALMLRPIAEVLPVLDDWFGIAPGDLVFTGTPEGVRAIATGDTLDLALDGVPAATSRFVLA
jgi:2-keto-4-pentenoate hydratase/2-oxohepta-3-ene-1,7-dioic acid hydratase in catechol pathway